MFLFEQVPNKLPEPSRSVKNFILRSHILEPEGPSLPTTDPMATRNTDNIITGSDPRLGMCFYFSPYFNDNIWRRYTPLTGERVKKDPAFEGFRRSCNRLKQAAPIAGSLYKLLPKELRPFALYRILTGKVFLMLKEGMDEAVITETLHKEYIIPILETPEKAFEYKTVRKSGKKDRVKGMKDFTSIPEKPAGVKKLSRKRRALLLQQIVEGQSVHEYAASEHSDPQANTRSQVSTTPLSEPEKPRARTKTTDGLIYLGRLPECKKLKMWLRPLTQ